MWFLKRSDFYYAVISRELEAENLFSYKKVQYSSFWRFFELPV